MWSYDEQKEISEGYITMARVRCPHCNTILKKYVKSWYTGGEPCVLLARYCMYCGGSLERST